MDDSVQETLAMRRLVERLGWTVALLVSLGAVSGCGTMGAPPVPDVFKVEDAYSKGQYLVDRARYAGALDGGDVSGARRVRDEMLQRTIGDVDRAYFKFRNEFHEGREITNTIMDMAKLGMSAAATVLGGHAALSAAVTALEGTSLSVEKNFFREKTTEVLFTTMDGLRDNQKGIIQRKRVLSPPDYGFDEAFNDAVLLYNAGTVVSALQKMAAEAGKQATEGKTQNEEATKALIRTLSPVTKASVVLKEKLSSIVTQLTSDREDNGKLTSIKKILEKRRVAFAVSDSANVLYGKLADVLDEAQGDQKIAELVAVFKEVGVWKE